MVGVVRRLTKRGRGHRQGSPLPTVEADRFYVYRFTITVENTLLQARFNDITHSCKAR